jgi:hypothetical protein
MLSVKCTGATHDSLAWDCTAVCQAIENGRLGGDFYIIGDEAFVCINQVLTTWPGETVLITTSLLCDNA